MASTGEQHGLFWNAVNHDRQYDSASFERWLKKFFTTGVFEGDYQVLANSGMTVTVGTGYCNIQGKVKFNDTVTQLTLAPANSTYPRIDTVVITRDNANRTVFIDTVTGAYSGDTPQPTAPVRTGEIYQIVLAQIYIAAATTEITQVDITDTRTDTELCGYIAGTVQEMDFSQFAARFEAYYQHFVDTSEASYDAWFQNVQAQQVEDKEDWDAWYAALQEELHNLPSDTAEYLQIQIDEIKESGTTGSILKISTDLPQFETKTVTVQNADGTEIRTGEFDENLECVISGFKSIGDVTITSTDGVDTISATINIECFSNYSVALTSGFKYEEWLTAGRVSGTYADLDAVLADEKAVRQLMIVHDSVDYLAENYDAEDADITKILENDICAKWINLSDYALDTLYAVASTQMDSIGKYGYGEWALMPQVPKMTSNSAPYGTASASSEHNSTYAAWRAFDETAYNWLPSSGATNNYVRYAFVNPIKPSQIVVDFYCEAGSPTRTFTIQGSNDNFVTSDNLGTISIESHSQSKGELYKVNVDASTTYTSLQLFCLDTLHSSGNWSIRVVSLQFYAWAPKGNVPVMTSNSAPYGTAIRSDIYGSSFEAWKAFDNVLVTDDSSAWKSNGTTNKWIGYNFTNPISVKRFSVFESTCDPTQNVKTLKLQYSNDNSTWTDASEVYTYNNGSNIRVQHFDSNVDVYALYWRIMCIDNYGHSGVIKIDELQFYGREMSVSVPTMTSNTEPYGEVSASSVYGNNAAWKAFDNNTNDQWSSDSGSSSQQIAYKAVSPFKIKAYYVYSNGTNDRITAWSLQGSNDGTTWDTLDERTASSAVVDLFEVENNSECYLYHRLNITASASGISAGCGVKLIYFFGFNYSEKEFEVGTNKKWLYDHGVELEELTLETGSSGGVAERRPDSIYVEAGGANIQGLARFDIDTTQYSIYRGRSGLIATNIAASAYSIKMEARTISDSYIAHRLVQSSDLPNRLYLDIININDTVRLNAGASGNQVCSIDFTELWLE